jgi:hypothetical protein
VLCILKDHIVISGSEPVIANVRRVMTCVSQQLCHERRQRIVDQKLHDA